MKTISFWEVSYNNMVIFTAENYNEAVRLLRIGCKQNNLMYVTSYAPIIGATIVEYLFIDENETKFYFDIELIKKKKKRFLL